MKQVFAMLLVLVALAGCGSRTKDVTYAPEQSSKTTELARDGSLRATATGRSRNEAARR